MNLTYDLHYFDLIGTYEQKKLESGVKKLFTIVQESEKSLASKNKEEKYKKLFLYESSYWESGGGGGGGGRGGGKVCF